MSVTRKFVICMAIFLSLFMFFLILDFKGNQEVSKQGIIGEGTDVLQIQYTNMDEVETANINLPFKSREYVRIVPK